MIAIVHLNLHLPYVLLKIFRPMVSTVHGYPDLNVVLEGKCTSGPDFFWRGGEFFPSRYQRFFGHYEIMISEFLRMSLELHGHVQCRIDPL